MKINPTVMFTNSFTRDELYILRLQIWQLYKIRAYATGEHLTSVANMVARFVEADSYKLELVHNGKVVFSFHPTTKQIELDTVLFYQILPHQVRGETPLGMAIASLLDNLFQDVSGQSQYTYDTMTTSAIRRKVSDFHGLLLSCGKLSNEDMHAGDYCYIRERGDGYALYDAYNMLVVHVTHKRMHFGMGYVMSTDVNENIVSLIDRFRPVVLDIRKEYREVHHYFGKMLEKTWSVADQMITQGANRLTQAVRFNRDRFEFGHSVVTSGGSKVEYDTKGIKLGYVFNGQFIGEITHTRGNELVTMDADVADRIRKNPTMLTSLPAQLESAHALYVQHVENQVNYFFEFEHLKDLGLDPATARPYLDAYNVARDRGYRGSFAEFVQLIQTLQQLNLKVEG
ncbi:hypothetical protein [Pseudomonas phage D6]|nr:hypothetical protein [Pseudomonas phage D6]